jgi:hypothetical protein
VTASPGVTVAVCTRGRPAQLARLLGSLAALAPPGGGDPWAATLIVDNDPSGSAGPVAEPFAGRLPGLRHVVEPVPGLAAARNRAVAEAATRFVAFVDDDQTVDPAWLRELVAARRRTGAGAVVGKVTAAATSPVPRWLADSGAFDLPSWPDGARITTLATCGVLLDLDRLGPWLPLFDERFSALGGEDQHLGRRLAAGGVVLVHAGGAASTEWLPDDRTTPRAVARRMRAAGARLARVDLALTGGRAAWSAVAARHASVGLAKVLLGVVAVPGLAVPALRARAARVVWRALVGAGQLEGVAGRGVELYRHPGPGATR